MLVTGPVCPAAMQKLQTALVLWLPAEVELTPAWPCQVQLPVSVLQACSNWVDLPGGAQQASALLSP